MGGKKKGSGTGNAFFHFMMYYKNLQGNRSLSNAEAAERAGALWKNMNEEEREPFKEKARRERNNAPKMTALNENMEMVAREEEEKVAAEERMRSDISSTIRRLSLEQNLSRTEFHVMHMNNFCHANSTQRHYPAEIALLRFNLESGYTPESIYHQVIKPGKIPLGYSFSTKQHSEETHRLKPPQDSEDNMLEVFMAIVSFLNQSSTVDGLPVIYVSDNDMKYLRDMIDQWCDDYDYPTHKFRLYSLQYLLYVLRNSQSSPSEPLWPTVSQSVLEFERDVFNYTEGIACSLHEEIDAIAVCSRSIVIRYAFIVCDNVCDILGIELIPGRHVPSNSNVTAIYSGLQSASSFYSCASSRAPSVAGSRYPESTSGLDEAAGGPEAYSDEEEREWHPVATSRRPGRRWEDSTTESYADSVVGARSTMRSMSSVPSTSTGFSGFNANFPALGRGRGRGLRKN